MYAHQESDYAGTFNLQKIRKSLESLKIETSERINDPAERDQLRAGTSSDRSMMARSYIVRQANSNNLARAERLLVQIEDALTRLNEGTYGRCTRCGQRIRPGRLEALPYAEYCVSCKAIKEKNRSN